MNRFDTVSSAAQASAGCAVIGAKEFIGGAR
jgi:hypothetical protein